MKKWIFLGVIALAMAVYGFTQPKLTVATTKSTPPPQSHGVAYAPKVQRTPAQASAAAAIPSKENDSISELITTLSQVGQPASSLKNLVEHLQRSGQEPLVIRDANPDSGEMIIVRTKSPLPGTRYFHAQYFTGEDGERFVQHMSFEVKPGPDAMATAIALVEKTFPNLSRPKIQRKDYYMWDLDDKYIVWVKRMGPADLKDDPFNAYTLSDDGTIRVAVELEIHGDS